MLSIIPNMCTWCFRLFVINSAVLYNLIFVIGRSVFWQLQNLLPIGWFVLDYFSDLIYVLDIIVRYVINQIQLVFFFRTFSPQGSRGISWPGNHGERRQVIKRELQKIWKFEVWYFKHLSNRPCLPSPRHHHLSREDPLLCHRPDQQAAQDRQDVRVLW